MAGAGLLLAFPDTLRNRLLPCLLSYATGTLLGAAFLGMLPTSLAHAPAQAISATVLAGLVVFFILEKLGVKTYPSQTYFFLADFAPRDASVIAEKMKTRGILIKPLNDPKLGPGFMRVTTALPEDNATSSRRCENCYKSSAPPTPFSQASARIFVS
jgi:hypothetical protein